MKKRYVQGNTFAALIALFLIILVGACMSPLDSIPQLVGGENKIKKDKIKINESSPRYFETNQGKTWIPVMINLLVPGGNESYVFGKVEEYFKKFSENGGNAVRIWVSSPFLEIEDTKQGEYNPDKFTRIDKLIQLAGEYNIRVKFTLQHITSIKPDDNSYLNKAILSNKAGGTFEDIHQYVNSSEGKENYLNRVKALSDKYKDNNQIFCWELWNEMDVVDKNWDQFSMEMLDSVKKLFPNHLVTQSLSSMNSEGASLKYEKLLTLEKNDYIAVHQYLDPGTKWDQYDHVHGPIDLLVSKTMQFVYREGIPKPVVFDEIGAVAANFSGPSELYKKDSVGVLIHDMIFAPFFCGASACGSMWHWEVYINRQNLWYHYKRFNIAVKGIDPVKEKFVPFTFEKDSVRCYGLDGDKTTMIWCRDGRNNWATELEQGIQPKTKHDFSIDTEIFSIKKYSIAKVYDPWKNKWTIIPINKSRISLPPFLRSSVIVLQ